MLKLKDPALGGVKGPEPGTLSPPPTLTVVRMLGEP